MMKTTTMLAAAVALWLGCAGEERLPCDEAVAHYYAVGCIHDDATTGDLLSLSETVERCEILRRFALTEECDVAVESWVICLATAPATGSEIACDCEREREAIRACQGGTAHER